MDRWIDRPQKKNFTLEFMYDLLYHCSYNLSKMVKKTNVTCKNVIEQERRNVNALVVKKHYPQRGHTVSAAAM